MPARRSLIFDEFGEITYVTSGSFLLDKMLGGGWGAGRVVNVVGDRSSGKTLLAIEASANYARLYGADHVRYAEAEDAMDEAYAKKLGMPSDIGRTEPGTMQTVQDFASDSLKYLEGLDGEPALYTIDSLDALSEEEENKKTLGDEGYGTRRPKLLSEFFRKHNGKFARKNCTLMVISQVRDNIGVMFGEKSKRSGGRALDFYASQIVWLSEVGKIYKTVAGQKRVIGAEVKARTKKNKIGIPFRDVTLQIIFGYGIDDELSMLDWLHEVKALDGFKKTLGEDPLKVVQALRKQQDRRALADFHKKIAAEVGARWDEIEDALKPPMSKYGGPNEPDPDLDPPITPPARLHRRPISQRARLERTPGDDE